MRGGFREGSGRKKRQYQSVQYRADGASKGRGRPPVDFLLKLMRDETLDTRTRLYAAKAAAPYVHHKLSAMKLEASTDLTHEDWLRSLV